MKYYNCFVKYENSETRHSMFIQISEDIMNNQNPDAIRSRVKKEIAVRHNGDYNFAMITSVTILGCYNDNAASVLKFSK